MVDIRLDLNEELRQTDCFVSVRVGENQKLSRLSKSRVYSFPNAGDKHFGKIEVFRRIGSCAIDIDPAHLQSRVLSVSCNDKEIQNLPLTVAVEATAPRAPKEAVGGKKDSEKTRLAKDYLSAHCLEVHLSEAMQVLLRERPSNPTEFLAKQLLNCAVGSVVPSSPKKQPADVAKPNIGRIVKKETDVTKAGLVSNRPSPAVLPFASYAREYIQTSPIMNNVFFRSAYAKFPSKWAPPKTKFQIYCSDHIHGMPRTSLNAMYNKFPAFKNSSVVAAVGKSVVASTNAANWAHKASVGTWAMRPPRTMSNASVRGLAAWASQPSVGTWAMQLPRGSRGVKADTSAPVEPVGWAKQPSVGTWLAKPRRVLKAPELKSYNFRPSVATWLVLAEDNTETEAANPAHNKMVVWAGDLYGHSLPFSNHIRLL
eukprot:TRINITY_DN2010_c0_g1_i1.p1 TRINITY_DN2010_c0_g1~~TRINITY_DN2010_c0_g1_i1.p1  ORF type:complete len:469 (+),score=66.05 TRINITY_DN2010_c0_g1_i1:132-1409(+)